MAILIIASISNEMVAVIIYNDKSIYNLFQVSNLFGSQQLNIKVLQVRTRFWNRL